MTNKFSLYLHRALTFLFIINFNFLLFSRICKDDFDFDFEIAVSESIHHRLSNLQNESAAFFSLAVKALVTVILLWEEGSVWQDLTVLELLP